MVNFIRAILAIAVIPIGLPTMFVSFTLFDSADAEKSIFTQILFWSMFLSPVFFLSAFALSYRNTKFLYLPIINIVGFIIGLLGVQIIQHGYLVP